MEPGTGKDGPELMTDLRFAVSHDFSQILLVYRAAR